MEHQVQAHLEGRTAALACGVCGARTKVVDGDFEAVNDFIQVHKPCADPWDDAVSWSGLPGGRP